MLLQKRKKRIKSSDFVSTMCNIKTIFFSHISDMNLTFRDIKKMRGLQMVNRRRTIKSKKTDNKKFAEKIICICGRRFSYVGGLTYHKKVRVKYCPIDSTKKKIN